MLDSLFMTMPKIKMKGNPISNCSNYAAVSAIDIDSKSFNSLNVYGHVLTPDFCTASGDCAMKLRCYLTPSVDLGCSGKQGFLAFYPEKAGFAFMCKGLIKFPSHKDLK